MMKQIIFYTIFIVFFSGCVSERLEPKINFNAKPTIQKVPTPKPKIISKENQNGSLFKPDNDLYSSNSKTLDVGDLIIINIVESLTADSIGERKTNKTNNTDLGGGVVAPVPNITQYGGISNLTKKVNSVVGLGFKTDSASTFTGKTSAKHNENFTATISAVIQQRYQNGNYLVYGQKEILIDGQLQIIQISGVVRPYDIKLPDNSISSSKLANAKIMYKKQGVEHDSTVKPWGTSVIENVWPF